MLEKTFNIKNENVPFVSSEKIIKSWNVENRESTGGTISIQRPTNEELERAKLQLGSEPTNYTFTTRDISVITTQFNAYPENGEPAYVINATEGEGGVYTVNVTTYTLVPVIEGNEHEDDVDYGTDGEGEGNIDYSDWTTIRRAKVTDERWFLEWDDVKNWPPFSKYGKQWIDPWCLKAYKLLVDGGHFEGDLVTMAINGVDYTMPINMFEQETIPEGMTDDEAAVFMQQLNPPGTAKEAYYILLKEKVLILVHTWSKQWVISKTRFKHEFEDMTEKEKEEYDNKGILITTEVRGNEDGKVTKEMDEHGVPIIASKTYTVTRTWTDRKIWDKSMVNKLPIGMKLKEPAKNPEP